MNILVAVASKHGSTREIAQAIADELRGAHIPVDLQDVAAVRDVTSYDAVILGSGIYMGRWLPQASGFAEEFHTELATRPVWIFSSGPLGADDPQPQQNPAQLATALSEIPIRDHQIFVGKLDPRQLGLGERLIASVVGAPDGDFRDWAAIRTWAQAIAAALHPLDVSSSVHAERGRGPGAHVGSDDIQLPAINE